MKLRQAGLSQSMAAATPSRGAFCKCRVTPKTVTATWLSLGQLWRVPYLSYLKQYLNPVVASGWTQWKMSEDTELRVTKVPWHSEAHYCLGENRSPFKSCFVKNLACVGLLFNLPFRGWNRKASIILAGFFISPVKCCFLGRSFREHNTTSHKQQA